MGGKKTPFAGRVCSSLACRNWSLFLSGFKTDDVAIDKQKAKPVSKDKPRNRNWSFFSAGQEAGVDDLWHKILRIFFF